MMKRPFRATGDLLVVLAWTAAAAGAILVAAPVPIRTVLALPLVVLLPGYALLAVLFPRRQEGNRARRNSTGGGPATLTHLERFALSLTTSLALVPATAFVVNFTPFGVGLWPVLFAVCGLTVGLTIAAYLARVSVEADSRYRVPIGPPALVRTALVGRSDDLSKPAPFEPSTGTQRLFNVAFLAGLVVLAATVGFVAVTPAGDQGPFTEFYLLTASDDGGYTTENLPHEFTRGQSRSLYVAVGNHEGESVEYTVVVQLAGEELSVFRVGTEAGETRRVRRSITPTRTGDRLDMAFLLYRGAPPANPTAGNAYRTLHLRVTVR